MNAPMSFFETTVNYYYKFLYFMLIYLLKPLGRIMNRFSKGKIVLPKG